MSAEPPGGAEMKMWQMLVGGIHWVFTVILAVQHNSVSKYMVGVIKVWKHGIQWWVIKWQRGFVFVFLIALVMAHTEIGIWNPHVPVLPMWLHNLLV